MAADVWSCFSPAAESMFGRTSTEMIIDEVHSLI